MRHRAFGIALALALASTCVGEDLLLTRRDALVSALERNPSLAGLKLLRRAARADLYAADATWDPEAYAEASYSYSEARSRINPLITGGIDTEISDARSAAFGVKGLTPIGATWDLSWETARDWTNSAFYALNPAYDSIAALDVSFPLLRGGWYTGERLAVDLAGAGSERAEAELLAGAAQTLLDVEMAYWTLSAARSQVEVREVSLRRATDLLDEARKRFDVGQLIRAEVLAAEAGVAARRVELIVAQDARRDAEDALKELLGLTEERLSDAVVPLEEPAGEPAAFDEADVLKTAFSQRPELKVTQAELEAQRARVALARRERLPRLDLTAGFRYTGLDSDVSASADDLARMDHEAWVVGVAASWPLGGRAARSGLEAGRLRLAALTEQAREVRLSVAREVRDAVRQVASDTERISATLAAREAQRLHLEDERKRFSAGLATASDVLLYEEELASAEAGYQTARTDLAASIARVSWARGTYLSDNGFEVIDE